MHLFHELESRYLLAGQVTVTTDANYVKIVGNPTPNVVTLGRANDGRPFVAADNLIVDGQPVSGQYVFDVRSLSIDLGPGSDTLRLIDAPLAYIFADLGEGDDRVEWTGGQAEGGTFRLGNGEDRFGMAGGRCTSSALSLQGEGGRDRFGISAGSDINSLEILDAYGPTYATIDSSNFGSLYVETGKGIDRVSVTGGNIRTDLFVSTESGGDTINLVDYVQPSYRDHVVLADSGSTVVDRPKRRTPPTGRIDATFDGDTLTLIGTGSAGLSFTSNYGSFEESAGTFVTTDQVMYLNGKRLPRRSFLLDRASEAEHIIIRMDDAAQSVSVDFDGFLFEPYTLDIATGGGDDTVDISEVRSTSIGIDTGRGNDRVSIASGRDATVNLGPGRDRLDATHATQLNVFDRSGPATVTLTDATITGGLYIETSNAIDRVILSNVTAERLGLRLGGGQDIFSETNVRIKKRDIDLGPQ